MIEKFQAYTALLLEWNKRIHLVSKRDATGDRILRHFVDSLSIFKAIDIPKQANVLDLGAGAGFPSIPIQIVREDVRLTLVESIHKKTLFLQKLTQVLKLANSLILNQRAEELAHQSNLKEKFDLVVAKAMGKLKDVITLSMPFLKKGGVLLAYKGRGVKREIEEIGSPKDCRIKDVAKIEIPEMDLSRWLVLVEKVAKNSKKMLTSYIFLTETSELEYNLLPALYGLPNYCVLKRYCSFRYWRLDCMNRADHHHGAKPSFSGIVVFDVDGVVSLIILVDAVNLCIIATIAPHPHSSHNNHVG